MYKKLAVGISICSGATATIIPLVLMWLGYKTPLKLVLWLYLLLISISLVFCLASLCYVKRPYPQLAGEVRAAVSDLAALKFEILQKVGDAVGNIQTYQL